MMFMLRPWCALTLAIALCLNTFGGPQNATNAKYKLTIVENAGTAKRVKKGRVSSQTVIKVTDENDVPVAGIAVAFTIPHLVGGGATFVNGATASFVSTNAAGMAASGSLLTSSTSAFSLGVTASVPGGAISLAVPVNAAAALGGAGAAGAAGGSVGAAGAGAGAGVGAGVSAGVIGGIVAGVGAVVVGVAVAVAKGSADSKAARGTIGLGGAATVGPPH